MPNQATKEPAVPLLSETLRGGQMWSRVIKRGQRLRIIDSEGGAQVAALLFNAERPLERYNMPDTLKAQHTAFLTAGHVCYSDMGRVMCSIIEDTVGWHDTFCGVSDAGMIAARYGHASFQTHRNSMYRNGKDGLLIFSVGGGNLEKNVSPNLVSAIQLAKSVGASIVGIVGRDGGYTAKEANACVIIATVNHDHVTLHEV